MINQPDRKVRVLLVDSYGPDNRFSMQLFIHFLSQMLPQHGVEVHVAEATTRFSGKLGKLINKFVLFPWSIYRQSKGFDLVHIGDPAQAIFVNYLPVFSLVTVHDLHGVRPLFNEKSDSNHSVLLTLWHRLMLRGLRKANHLVCVSEQTYDDAVRYTALSIDRISMIENSTYQVFPEISEDSAKYMVSQALPKLNGKKFLFHIGSNDGRKNRITVVRVLAELRKYDDYALVFAGKLPDAELKKEIERLELGDFIFGVERPNVDLVSAFYRAAECLIFPSTYEGFGLPVAEAQMNLCPVVCSAIPTHAAILAGTGLMADALDVDGFADLVRKLEDGEFRTKIKLEGKKNSARYQPEIMISQYESLYRRLWKGHRI